jgi:hypothetical protein
LLALISDTGMRLTQAAGRGSCLMGGLIQPQQIQSHLYPYIFSNN